MAKKTINDLQKETMGSLAEVPLWRTPPPASNQITAWALCDLGDDGCVRDTPDGKFWDPSFIGTKCYEFWTSVPTKTGQMHIRSYCGQGQDEQDTGGFDHCIDQSTAAGFNTASRAVIVDWGSDPYKAYEDIKQKVEEMVEVFALIMIVCTALQLVILSCKLLKACQDFFV